MCVFLTLDRRRRVREGARPSGSEIATESLSGWGVWCWDDGVCMA